MSEGRSQVWELMFKIRILWIHHTSPSSDTTPLLALILCQGLTWMRLCHSQCAPTAALRGRCCLCIFLRSYWGHFWQQGRFMLYITVRRRCMLVTEHTESYTITSPSPNVRHISKSICLLNVVSIYRSHIWLLWRKPDGYWCEGHSGYLCHIPCIVPLLAGWIHWPGSHKTGFKDLH